MKLIQKIENYEAPENFDKNIAKFEAILRICCGALIVIFCMVEIIRSLTTHPVAIFLFQFIGILGIIFMGSAVKDLRKKED